MFFQVFVAHVLPEGIAGRELHVTISVGTLDTDWWRWTRRTQYCLAWWWWWFIHWLGFRNLWLRRHHPVGILGWPTRGHLSLRDILSNYGEMFGSNCFFNLLVGNAKVTNHRGHFFVLIWAEWASVRGVSRCRQVLRQESLVVSLGQVSVKVTRLPSLYSIAVDAEDAVRSTGARFRWKDVLVSLWHIVRCLLGLPIDSRLLYHHSLLRRRSRRWSSIFLLVLSLRGGWLAIAGWTRH